MRAARRCGRWRSPGRPRRPSAGARLPYRAGSSGPGRTGTGHPRPAGPAPSTARSLGTAGLFCTPLRNDADSAEISTAPASAVPIDAPRLVTVFCTPPTSPLCVVGHRGHGHGPELRGQRADPEAREQHRPGHDLRPGARVERGQHDHDASEQARGTRSGPPGAGRRAGRPGERPRRPAAASATAAAAGRRSRPPDSPSATDKNNGTTKNRPACRKYWKKNAMSPPRSVGFRSSAGSSSTAPPRARRWFSHQKKSHEHDPARQDQPDHRRQPQPRRLAGLGLDEAPRPRAQDAVHDQPQAERGQHGPHHVEPRALLGRGVGDPASQPQDDEPR